MIHSFSREQYVPGDPAQTWAFFASPHNLDRLTPPDLRFAIVGDVAPRMYAGQMIEYRIGVTPGVTTRWLTEITHVREPHFFVDEQRIGPYQLWHHEHHFAAAADGRGVHMTDRITYDPGWGPLGGIVNRVWLRRRLAAIFDFRARAISELFPSTPPHAPLPSGQKKAAA